MNAARPVLVTGVGVVSPLGCDLDAFDSSLFTGRSAVRAQALELPGMERIEFATAACGAFDAAAMSGESRLPLDRGTAMALSAARDAAAHAQLSAGGVDAFRFGVFWGSGIGGSGSFDAAAAGLYGERRRMRPTTVLTVMPNAAVAEIALQFGARGAALGYACACASSAVAIGEAMRAIRGGWIDVALAGGHEAMLTPGLMSAWHAMRVLASVPSGGGAERAQELPFVNRALKACRPFSADRAGFALGEGAAAFVLESPAHARSRGASAIAALSGYATNCDATHLTKPDPAGQARAMREALRDAGLAPGDIGYLNAHGTATAAGDAAEGASIEAVFGGGVPVSATKAIHGHVMGAGGAVELLASLRALAHRQLPPTAHLDRPDAAFGALDFVRGEARAAPALAHAMSNSFAFGGTNAVLIASRIDGAAEQSLG